MAEIADSLGAVTSISPSVIEGVQAAMAAAKTDEVVLVTGSLFVVGEVLAAWEPSSQGRLATVDRSEEPS
jgi:folylpolyglutamate synthase/dihydropteroate synthase